MATEKLKNQMDGFMRPATDEAPTMGLYDTNTPQSVREGTPLRLFDKSRARYKAGDVVEDNYNRALAIYSAMKNADESDAKIKERIGELQYNKIIMNKANVKKAATGGLMGGDPRLGKVEDVGYQAYAYGGPVLKMAAGDTPFQSWLSSTYDKKVEDLSAQEYSLFSQEWTRLQNNKAEGGEIKVPELAPEAETSLEMQMEEAMPQGEEGEMDVQAQVDTSVLDSEEEQLLEEVIEMHPGIMDVIVKLTAKEFTGEGEVDGPGTGTSDSIPAMLSDGEFVFTAKAVKQIGVDRLRKQMKAAEQEYDNSMAVQDSQMESGQPMMAKGGLLSADKYKI
ncbi:hypothetical protein HTVC115P_gp72 [Pelagibacter phage HTVC115P]|nr:hypothetical protein HTVC115P_gp72 [Pelagibacter phage HTVC115P]